MPVWGQIIVGSAAIVAAIGVLWSKVLKPLLQVHHEMVETLPVIREAVEAMKDAPGSFLVLQQIAAQFRTDSGSSLRDVADRLETAVELLGVRAEASRVLAVKDRAVLQVIVDAGERASMTAGEVAADLEAAHERAESEPATADPGVAADSAMRRPDMS